MCSQRCLGRPVSMARNLLALSLQASRLVGGCMQAQTVGGGQRKGNAGLAGGHSHFILEGDALKGNRVLYGSPPLCKWNVISVRAGEPNHWAGILDWAELL